MITRSSLKVGVVTDGSWGPSTQWHHLNCTIFKTDKTSDVEGFDDLEEAAQVTLLASIAYIHIPLV